MPVADATERLAAVRQPVRHLLHDVVRTLLGDVLVSHGVVQLCLDGARDGARHRLVVHALRLGELLERMKSCSPKRPALLFEELRPDTRGPKPR